MKDETWLALAQRVTLNSPADDREVAAAERELGLALPQSYVSFLHRSNGAEGFASPEDYVQLWAVQELAGHNRRYDVADSAPGLMLFGSSGGGEAYGFDTRHEWCVVAVPFVTMSWEDARRCGESFGDFLDRLTTGGGEHPA